MFIIIMCANGSHGSLCGVHMAIKRSRLYCRLTHGFDTSNCDCMIVKAAGIKYVAFGLGYDWVTMQGKELWAGHGP